MQLLNLNTITMTSLEMVAFINQNREPNAAVLAHSDFLKKVPQVLGEAVAGTFSCYYKASNGKQNPCYTLPKREACLMAMSYSYELQAKVFDKMTELESNQSKFKIPQTLSEALFLSAELAKTVEQQTLQLQAQAPAVAYVDNFVKCDGLIGIREAAKSLGLQQNAFVQMLIASKIMFRENNHLQSYQSNIDNKRFAVKITKDINGKARSSTLFTAKGIRWVAQELELDKLFINDV